MKIVVVSDTHRNYRGLKDVVEANLDADLYIHLGDGKFEFDDVCADFPMKNFVMVKGNCDYYAPKFPEERILDLDGVKVLCVHGNHNRVDANVSYLAEYAIMKGCKIALYGHTHVYNTECFKSEQHADEKNRPYEVFLMNPGSITTPRGKNPPSYGIIELSGGGKINMKIVQI